VTIGSVVVAYFLSVFVGMLITTLFVKCLVRAMERRLEPNTNIDATARIEWLSAFVGISERAIITTLVIWSPRFLGGFLVGWMALKVASGWGLLKEPTLRNRSIRTIALLGSVVSIGWAIIIGLYFAPDAAVQYLKSTSN